MGEQNISDITTDEIIGLGLRIFIVPNSGHAMMHDNPVEFKNILLRTILL
jgi:hypothetical protein